MFKLSIAILLGIIYGILGAFLENNKIIVEPANFSLYGVYRGIFISCVMDKIQKLNLKETI